MKFSFLLLLVLIQSSLFAQFNFGFEEYKNGSDTLAVWNIATGRIYAGPQMKVDREVKHSGKQSLSIERSDMDTATKFTPASVLIKADFEGQQLRFTCWMKTENVKGRVQMWLNIVDAQGTNLQLVNFPSAESVNGTTDWKQYTTSTALPADADKIRLGFLLVGTGKVWADDFDMYVDNKPLEKAIETKKTTYKAALDNKEFENGSGISINTVTKEQQENLALLGKIWGFLKYYHPVIAKGELNWDYELFRFLPAYLDVRNVRQRNELLLQWINKLGTPGVCSKCSDAALEKALYKPDLDWISDRSLLGDSLVNTLNYIRKNRHRGKNYYMDLAPGVLNPKITHEPAYAKFSYPDAGYRLLSLFRYWNIIQYWFPYKHLIGEDWKNVLYEFIPKMLQAGNASEYLLTTQQMIGRIHDTHANISGYSPLLDSLRGKLYSSMRVKFVDEKAVIVDVPTTPATTADIRVGDIILSIGGKKVTDIIKEKLPNLPASNYPTQLRNLSYELLRGSDSISNLTIERNGVVHETFLQRYDNRKTKLGFNYFDFPYQKDSSFFFIRPGIGYINLGKIKKAQLDSVFEALDDSKGLIIDNRQYPGEFVLYDLAAKLTPEGKPFTKIPVGNLDYPGAFSIQSTLNVGSNNKRFYDKRVIILVDEGTQSSAEFNSMAFQVAPKSIVVGSTTAGADGNVSGLALPGGIYTMFSGISILYPDGRETQRVGIVPDVRVTPTIEGIKNGRDELVEKAVELINTEKLDIKKKGF